MMLQVRSYSPCLSASYNLIFFALPPRTKKASASSPNQSHSFNFASPATRSQSASYTHRGKSGRDSGMAYAENAAREGALTRAAENAASALETPANTRAPLLFCRTIWAETSSQALPSTQYTVSPSFAASRTARASFLFSVSKLRQPAYSASSVSKGTPSAFTPSAAGVSPVRRMTRAPESRASFAPSEMSLGSQPSPTIVNILFSPR